MITSTSKPLVSQDDLNNIHIERMLQIYHLTSKIFLTIVFEGSLKQSLNLSSNNRIYNFHPLSPSRSLSSLGSLPRPPGGGDPPSGGCWAALLVAAPGPDAEHGPAPGLRRRARPELRWLGGPEAGRSCRPAAECWGGGGERGPGSTRGGST